MTERPDVPAETSATTDPLAFAPVPVRPRRDGWTVDKQIAFIETLAETGCVTRAARGVGMSVRSAYRLARRPDARSFAEAWDTAMPMAARALAALAFRYATEGMVEQIWKDGALVEERRRPSERLLIFLLSRHDPVRFGARPAPLEGQDEWPRDYPQRSLGEHFEQFRDMEVEADPDESASDLPAPARART